MNCKTYRRAVLGALLFVALLLAGFPQKSRTEAARKESADVQKTSKQQLAETYGKVPLSFESNAGQTSNEVKFLARGPGYTLFLTRHADAVVVLGGAPAQPVSEMQSGGPTTATGPRIESRPSSVFRMKLANARLIPQAAGLDELPGKVNYFSGNDRKKWRTNVPTYARVYFQAVYPGVDLAYYGNQRQLEYDFVVAPHADPASIALTIEGAGISLAPQGDLVLTVKDRTVRFQKPVVYQVVDGDRREIPSAYSLKDGHQFGFQLAAYDRSLPLIIDPVLAYSTYLDGSGNSLGKGIVADSAGNAYLVGITQSADFPTTTGAFQKTGPAPCSFGCDHVDAFVTKLNPAGSTLVYSTFLGGSGHNDGNSIAVDPAGDVYVTGATNSIDFPTTPGAFQPILRSSMNGGFNAFVTKLNPSGSGLIYSTYLGGSGGSRGNFGQSEGGDQAFGIAVDRQGNVYVTGSTTSRDFPTTPGAFQTTNPAPNQISGTSAFVTKLQYTGALLVYSTYLGGSSNGDSASGIAVDNGEHAYVTGSTASTNFPTTSGAFQSVPPAKTASYYGSPFVTEMSRDGSELIYSTYLGGDNSDSANAIAIDSDGNAYVTGSTLSRNFPTTPGAFQSVFPAKTYNYSGSAFATKLNNIGSGLVYSTYVGGSGSDRGVSITVDSLGDAFLTGSTYSSDFPTTPNAVQTALAGGAYGDAVVLALNPQGSALVYSSYLGGSGGGSVGSGIAVDSSLNVYVTGTTMSTAFPTTPGAFQSTAPQSQGRESAFVTKVSNITQ